MMRVSNKKKTTLLSQPVRRRGAAMMLVLVAVAMCTILALSFLAAQEPTAVVASNVDRKTQARAIAESALRMAVDYVNEDPNWRSDKTSGMWLADVAMDGGTFTLTGIDEIDGDLADDSSEAVRLSVVADFDGVTHRVSAVVTPTVQATPGNRLLLVVGDIGSPSSQDLAKESLFTGWGYTVTMIGDTDSVSAFNAALLVNDVVYVSEESFSFDIDTKLFATTLGVVNEEGQFQDDLGITTAGANHYDSGTSITILDNTHEVTSAFSVGELSIYTSSRQVVSTSRALGSGVTVLADAEGSWTDPTVMVAEVGDALVSGTAAGRRVTLPFGDNFDVNNLTADGQTLVQRSLAWAIGGGEPVEGTPTLIALYEFNEQPVADPVLVGHWKLDEVGEGPRGALYLSNTLTLDDASIIDAYDSSVGIYGGSNRQLDAMLFVNATGSGDIELDDSVIYGDVRVGAGADPTAVVQASGGGAVTGSVSAQTVNVVIPTYDAPDGFGVHEGNEIYDGGSHTWSTNRFFNKLILKNGARVTVSGNIEVRVQNFTDLQDGDIVLDPGATLTLWAGHDVTLSNGSMINNDTTRPGDFTLISYGNNRSVNLDDAAVIVGGVHGARDVILDDGSAIYGNVVVEEDLILDDSAIHTDLATMMPGDAAFATVFAFVDASVHANGGTASGVVGGEAGVAGTAFGFDGVDDYLVVPHHASYLLDEGSVSLHYYPTSTVGTRGLFSKDSAGNDNGGHLTVYTDGTRIAATIQTVAGDPYGTGHTVTAESGSGVVNANTWNHVVATWGDGQLRVYADGLLVASADHLGGLGSTGGGLGNDEPIAIGASTESSGDGTVSTPTNYFVGRIDDVRLYDKPLDAGQVGQVRAGTAPGSRTAPGYIVADTSGHGDALDLIVYDTSAVSWLSGGGLQFTGDTLVTSQQAAAKLHDAIDASGAFAIELFFQPATSGSTASPSRIVSYADGPNSHNAMLGQNGSKYEARVRDSSRGSDGVLSPAFVSSTSLTSATDTHLILTYVDGQASVFLNGNLDQSMSVGGVLDNWDVGHFLALAGAYTGGDHWRGTIKRLAIYDGGFNGIQADNVFNGNDPGSGLSGAGGVGRVQWDEQE